MDDKTESQGHWKTYPKITWNVNGRDKGSNSVLLDLKLQDDFPAVPISLPTFHLQYLHLKVNSTKKKKKILYTMFCFKMPGAQFLKYNCSSITVNSVSRIHWSCYSVTVNVSHHFVMFSFLSAFPLKFWIAWSCFVAMHSVFMIWGHPPPPK